MAKYCDPNIRREEAYLPEIGISNLFNNYKLAKYNKVTDFIIGEIFRKYVGEKGWTVADLTSPENVISIYRGVKAYLGNMLIDRINNPDTSIWGKLTDEAMQDIDKIIENFDTFSRHHAIFNNIAEIKQFNLHEEQADEPPLQDLTEDTKDENSEDIEEEDENKGRQYDKIGNEQSQIELASKSVRVLFRLIPKAEYNTTTKQSEIILDRDGLPTTANHIASWNLIAERVAGVKDYDKFREILLSEKLQQVVPSIQFINEILKTDKPNKSPSETDQFLQFYQAFSKPKVPIKSSYRDKDGVLALSDEILGNKQKIENAFNNNFIIGDIPEEYKVYVKKSPSGVNFLRKDEGDEQYFPPFPLTTEDKVRFLQFLGVKFSGLQFLDPQEVTEFEEMINEKTEFIYNSLKNRLDNGAIIKEPIKELKSSFNNLIRSEVTSVKALVEFEGRYSRIVPSHSSRTAEGELQHLISNDSALSIATYYLNSSQTLDELMRTPAFKNAKYNPHFRKSYIINFLFNEKGERVAGRTIQLELLSGDKQQREDGKTAGKVERKLSEKNKLIQDYNNFLVHGKTDVMRTETSHSFYMIGLYDKNLPVKYVNPKGFVNSFLEDKGFKTLISNYLNAEVQRIKSFPDKKVANPTIPDTFGDFSIFSEVFEGGRNPELRDRILSEPIAYDSTLFQDFLKAYEVVLNEELDRFKSLLDSHFITDSELFSEQLRRMNLSPDALHRAFIAGTLIQNIEFSVLYTGDTLFFKDMHKRLKGLSSTGSIAADIGLLQEYFTSPAEQTFRDRYSLASSLGIKHRDNNSNFRTQTLVEYPLPKGFAYLSPLLPGQIQESVTIRDGSVGVYTDDYIRELLSKAPEQKIADGEGYMTLDFHRELSIRFGFKNDQTEKAYKYEGLIFKRDILKNKLSEEERIEFEELEREIYASPNKFGLPPLKMTYWGNIENSSVDAKAYDKFSVAPILPSVARNHPKLRELMLDMVKGQYGYIKYESGTKLFKTTPVENIKDATPDLYTTPLLKEQIKTNSEQKTNTSIPTQMLKLIFTNLFDNGVPKTGRVKELFEQYVGSLKEIQREQVDRVLGDLGFSFTKEGSKVTITSFDVERLSKRLIREAKRQQLDSNIVSSLEINPVTGEFNISAEASGFQKQINELISGILDKSLRRFKFAGGDFILVSNANMSPLSWYKFSKNGTSASGARITLTAEFSKLLNRLHPDGGYIGTLERLNGLLKNKNWVKENQKSLTIILDRVPTQGPNSMDFAIVEEFLPPTAANIVILPDEIVFKAGLDFDYDKEKVITPFFDSNGNYMTNALARQEEVLAKLNEMQDIYPELQRLVQEEEEEGEEYNSFIINELFQTSNKRELLIADREIKKLLEEYKMLKGNVEAIKSNSILETYIQILSLPEMFVELISPNSNKMIRDISIANAVNIDESIELPQLGRTLYYTENLKVYKTFFDAKGLLAPFAIDNTFQQLLTHLGININDTYNKSKFVRGKGWTYLPFGISNLLLTEEENNKVRQEGKILTSLRDDINGFIKQHTNSQGINATVDAAKDPFFALLKVLWQNIGVVHFLKNQGVPFDRIVDFINHPTLRYYFALRENGMRKSAAIEKIAKERLGLKYYRTSEERIPKEQYSKFLMLPDQDLIKEGLLREGQTVALENGIRNVTKKGDIYTVSIQTTLYPTSYIIKDFVEQINAKEPVSISGLTYVNKWINYNPISPDRFKFLAKPENERSLIKQDPERKDENIPMYSDEVRIFAHFLELEDANYAFRDFQKYFNFDTFKVATTIDVRMKEKLREKILEQDMFSKEDMEKMEKESILSAFINNNLIKQVYNEMFPVLGKITVQNYLTLLYKAYDDRFDIKNKRDQRNLPKLLANDFLSSIVFNYGEVNGKNIFDRGKSLIIREQTGEVLKDGVSTPMYSKTMVDRLIAFRSQPYYKEIAREFPVLDRFISSKLPYSDPFDLNDLTEEFVMENIQFIKNPNETLLEREDVIEQLRNLYSFYEYTGSTPVENERITKAIKTFMDDLFTVGIVQSGFNKTFIGYSDYLPPEFTRKIYSDALNQFSQLTDPQVKLYMQQFYYKFMDNNPKYFPSYKVKDTEGKQHNIINGNKYSDRFKYYKFPVEKLLPPVIQSVPALPPTSGKEITLQEWQDHVNRVIVEMGGVPREEVKEEETATQTAAAPKVTFPEITEIKRSGKKEKYNITLLDGKVEEREGYRLTIKEYPKFQGYIYKSNEGWQVDELTTSASIGGGRYSTAKEALEDMKNKLNQVRTNKEIVKRFQAVGIFTNFPDIDLNIPDTECK